MHHTDPDGVCSGVITAKAIEKIRGKKIDLRLNQRGNEIAVLEKTADKIISEKVDMLITTDLCVDQRQEFLLKIAEKCRVIVIDHHKMYRNLNDDGILMIKSMHYNDKYDGYKYPCTKLCYDLFNDILDITETDWIAVIGIIGDMGYETWKEFCDKTMDKYGIDHEKEIIKTELGKIANLISDVECYDHKKAEDCFWAIYDSENYSDIWDSEVVKYQKIIQGEKQKWENKFKEYFENHKNENIIVFEIKSKYSIKSNLITKMSFRHEDKTFIFYQVKDGKVFISARNKKGDVKVNDLLEKACAGLGNAGGHIVAAGATIKEKDLALFLERIKKTN